MTAILWPSAQARANPWTMPAGDGRVIATAIVSSGNDSFDASGDTFDTPDFDQQIAFFSLEYGLTDDITLVANPGIGRIELEGGGEEFGLRQFEVGAKARLYHDDRLVVSAQATAIAPGSGNSNAVGQFSFRGMQYDVRAGVGYGFASGFSSVEGGYRLRDGASPNEFHVDASLGVKPAPKLTLLGNLFNTWSDGAGAAGSPSYNYHNLYGGAVLELDPRFSVQLGGLVTVAGRNALHEKGFYTGLWASF